MAKQTIISNEQATVANVVTDTVNKTAQEATQRVFENVIKLEKVGHMAEDIAALLV